MIASLSAGFPAICLSLSLCQGGREVPGEDSLVVSSCVMFWMGCFSAAPQAAPHLVFHNFTSKTGRRVTNILKYLYPPPNPTTQRVQAFINVSDEIHFRHYTWTKNERKKARSATATAGSSSSGKEYLSIYTLLKLFYLPRCFAVREECLPLLSLSCWT